MTPQEFNNVLQSSELTPSEQRDAWGIYKTGAISDAVSFVKNIEAKYGEHRKNQALLNYPVPYKTWGKGFIEEGTITQMAAAARLPVAVAGALMPDAHQGYGLPIGGVLATDNAIIPYAVGVDIACRMMLTVYPVEANMFSNPDSPAFQLLKNTLVENTVFGSGADGIHEGKIEHRVLDDSRWKSTELTRSLHKTAVHQIGTSGEGNHFVEWGSVDVADANNPFHLAPGSYLALLSHSGSRGVGYKIAQYYTQIAMARLDNLHQSVKHLAWLSLDSAEGQEYWEAMHLAGDFASANHHVIHERIAKATGLTPVVTIENHHNFAWKEKIQVDGVEREAIVHRKGATPAGKGVMGIIPGTMADTGYVVIGKGNPESLNSASHGSGRQMSRTVAKREITHDRHEEYLKNRGVTLIGGGLDEAPQAYKPIQEVMEAQKDLVDVICTFQPRIVRMAADSTLQQPKPLPENIVDAGTD